MIQTDIGSPLICSLNCDPNRFVQIGILLWDVQCDSQKVSGIYVDTMKNRKWIQLFLSRVKENKPKRKHKSKKYDII